MDLGSHLQPPSDDARIRILLLVAALTPLAAAAAQRAPGRPVVLEDHYRINSVASPDISPDGRWVTYRLAVPVEATNSDSISHWIVRTEGSTRPERVLHEGQDVTDAQWLDDGRLRYTHRRLVWVVDPSQRSRPAAPLTSNAITPGLTSPDGRWRAFTRAVAAPAPPAPPALTEFERRHEQRFRGKSLDWYPFRIEGQRFPAPDRRTLTPVEIFLVATDAGDVRQLTQLALQPGELQWSRDSRSLVFTAVTDLRDPLKYGASDLYRVTIDGRTTRLTDDGGTYAEPSFSPDGHSLAYLRSLGADKIIADRLDHGGPVDLYVQPSGGGTPRNLTAEWDLDPDEPRWTPDGRHLLFTAEVGGARHLFRVPAAGGRVEQITRGDRRLTDVDVDRAARRIAYLVGELDRPADVWVSDIDGRNERRLTDVNAEWLAEVSLARRPSTPVRYTSFDGTPVEGFLLFPHGYDSTRGPYPLVVVNHGGPHSASGYAFNFKHTLFAAHGYFVFLPNFRSSTGYGDAFKWGTWGSWGTKDGEDVLAGVDYLIEKYAIDRARVGSMGHSYGGILTNWLITRYPDRFKAAISGASESNWMSNYALSDMARTKEMEFFGAPWHPRTRELMVKHSPYLNAGGVRAATLFIHGEVDYRVPLEGSLQLYTALKKQGVPAKMLVYEGMGHAIRGHWNVVHRTMHELQWWKTYLSPSRTP